MTTSAKFCDGRPRGNCCLLYIRMVLRWMALDAVIQENAEICVACRMLGFGCSKQGRIQKVKQGVHLINIHFSLFCVVVSYSV